MPWSKRRRSTTTRRNCSKPAKSSASLCVAWTFRSFPRPSFSKPAAGKAPSVRAGDDAPMKTVGVLALQGDFEAHRKALERAGARALEIRTAAELAACDGLIVPGGEST